LKIKVLFISVHLNYGGAEVGLATTLKNIDKGRFDFTIVSIEKKGPIGEEIERLGFKVIYLNEIARLSNIALIKKVSRILRNEKPDILHTSLFYANFFGRMAALFNRPPVVITEERSMYTEKRFYHILIDKIFSGITDKIIVCSESVLNFTASQEGIRKDKFSLIYNAVDDRRFSIPDSREDIRRKFGLSSEDFIVGTVGSLISKKGHRFLIEAVNRSAGQIPSIKLLIAGEGEERKNLENLAGSLGIGDRTLFMGARNDVPELMKAMDVFILPSLQEGFPRTLIEAMYMGLAVCVSNISGIPEIVRDGENGFLIEPGDIEAIAEKILLLQKDSGLREKLGFNARKTVESGYLAKNYLTSLEGLYSKLYEEKNR
jgi:glycosyltransferase involved in cell wall biosynthesis